MDNISFHCIWFVEEILSVDFYLHTVCQVRTQHTKKENQILELVLDDIDGTDIEPLIETLSVVERSDLDAVDVACTNAISNINWPLLVQVMRAAGSKLRNADLRGNAFGREAVRYVTSHSLWHSEFTVHLLTFKWSVFCSLKIPVLGKNSWFSNFDSNVTFLLPESYFKVGSIVKVWILVAHAFVKWRCWDIFPTYTPWSLTTAFQLPASWGVL